MNMLNIKPKIVKKPLSKTQKHATKRSIWALGLFAILMIGFTALARKVRDAETIVFDNEVLRIVHGFSRSMYDAPIIWLTNLGGSQIVPVVALVIVVILFMIRRNTAALKIAISVSGAGLINIILKSLFSRSRPELWNTIVTESTFSFPSGHAMASSALAASVIVVTWNSRWRYHMLTIGIIYTISVGFSRLYLGVHYPTDIVAGWMVSVAWVGLVHWIFSKTGKDYSKKNLSQENSQD